MTIAEQFVSAFNASNTAEAIRLCIHNFMYRDTGVSDDYEVFYFSDDSKCGWKEIGEVWIIA